MTLTSKGCRLLLALMLGVALGWLVANAYAPHQIRSEATVFSFPGGPGRQGERCVGECVVVINRNNRLTGITVTDDEFYVLAGRRGIYVIEDVEWITGRHIRWHIEPIIYDSTSIPEG